jgi:hypothetical protein
MMEPPPADLQRVLEAQSNAQVVALRVLMLLRFGGSERMGSEVRLGSD